MIGSIPKDTPVDTVGADSRHGAALAVKHLHGLGCTRIGLVNGPVKGHRSVLQTRQVADVPTAVHGMASSTWTETGLTWNNRPAVDPAVIGSVAQTNGSSTSYDIALTPGTISSAVGGQLTLAIDSTGGDAFYITTRETAIPPQLVLTTG